MTLHVLTHESGNKCIFDTETNQYCLMQDMAGKLAIGGSFFDYFGTLQGFMESDKKMAIIPCFCSKREVVKKRYKVTLITRTEVVCFWNIEKIPAEWISHESNTSNPSAPKTGIEICYPNSAYLIYFVKERDCINDVRVKSVKKIDKKTSR